ncbi:MAG: RDD family protein [Thermoplasmata archaeon]|nr:RDD family protein [Thermoplasmata archaeon]
MTTGFDIIGSNKALQDHWVRRIVAYIVDWIILIVIGAAIGLVFLVLAPWDLYGFLFTGVIAVLYFLLFDLVAKGTPGKKILSLEVVATEGELDIGKVIIRNISKIFGLFLLIDWIVGMFTDGDPRQKMLDRVANVTVQRSDDRAYMEQQFRQMAYVPPHPTYQPPPGQPYQPQPQQPPQQPAQAPAGGWPHQEAQPKSDWPQHDPGQAPPQQQQPPPQQQTYQPPPGGAPTFCQNCGSTLSPGPDGRPTCAKCGAVY